MSATPELALEGLSEQVVACRRCPRLVAWRERVAREKRAAYGDEEYWGRPVPAFGAASARIVVIGLAPAAHGANRTGRVFTGDARGTGSTAPSTGPVWRARPSRRTARMACA